MHSGHTLLAEDIGHPWPKEKPCPNLLCPQRLGGHCSDSSAGLTPLVALATWGANYGSRKPPETSLMGLENMKRCFPPASWPVSSLPIWTFLKPKDRPLWALLQKWLQVPEKDPFVHIKLQALLTLHVSREPLMGKCYGKTVLSSPAADSTFVLFYCKK